MSRPRFLTNYGLGYHQVKLPASNFANEAEMLSQYPLASSNVLSKLGGADMIDYLPHVMVAANAGLPNAELFIPFEAAGGAYQVTDSRGKVVKCPTGARVYQHLVVSGNQSASYSPTLTTVESFVGKYIQYNDESLIWEALYAGVRAKLYDNWAASGLPSIVGYAESDRDADHLAWECAVEGATQVFGYLRAQLPGSLWTWALTPTRPARTDAVQIDGIPLTDLMHGQSGSGARWRGIGASSGAEAIADTYADLWIESARQAYQPIANQLDWLGPRIYIDERMRNWDQEVPGQSPPLGWGGAGDDLIIESYMRLYENVVDLAKSIAGSKPVYPMISPKHFFNVASPVTQNTAQMSWYSKLNTDLETHRQQMRRITHRVPGMSIWSAEDYNARVAFSVGRPQALPANAPPGGDVFATNYTMPEIVKTRVQLQRRFPGVFDHLHPHPNTQQGEDAWRTAENWELFRSHSIQQMERIASSAVLLGAAKQSTLLQYI